MNKSFALLLAVATFALLVVSSCRKELPRMVSSEEMKIQEKS